MKKPLNHLLIIFIGLCSLMQIHVKVVGQSSPLRKAELTFFGNYAVVKGDNVYNKYHEGFWRGSGFSVGLYIQEHYFIGLEISWLSSSVTNRHIIFNDRTGITYKALNFGYRFELNEHFDITPYGHLGANNGSNHGKFKGESYGIGVKLVKPILRKGMVFLSTEWNEHRFNIQSNPHWENKFNKASIIRVIVGAGLKW